MLIMYCGVKIKRLKTMSTLNLCFCHKLQSNAVKTCVTKAGVTHGLKV